MVLSLIVPAALFFGLILMVGRHVEASGELPPRLAWFVHQFDGLRLWHVLVVLGVLSWFAIEREPPTVMIACVWALVFLYARVWLYEFFFLMGLTDDAFPGRFDKLIWAFVLILLGPLGLWAFRRYHTTQWPESTDERLSAKPAMPRDWA
jgi:hypothetical protein